MLVKEVIEGRMEGKRGREKPRIMMLDDVKADTIALHGSETWTLRKYERDRLKAFEMWTWRNMENIIWKDHMTNEYVLDQVNEKGKLLDYHNIFFFFYYFLIQFRYR